jgi:hypothetical protein
MRMPVVERLAGGKSHDAFPFLTANHKMWFFLDMYGFKRRQRKLFRLPERVPCISSASGKNALSAR